MSVGEPADKAYSSWESRTTSSWIRVRFPKSRVIEEIRTENETILIVDQDTYDSFVGILPELEKIGLKFEEREGLFGPTGKKEDYVLRA